MLSVDWIALLQYAICNNYYSWSNNAMFRTSSKCKRWELQPMMLSGPKHAHRTSHILECIANWMHWAAASNPNPYWTHRMLSDEHWTLSIPLSTIQFSVLSINHRHIKCKSNWLMWIAHYIQAWMCDFLLHRNWNAVPSAGWRSKQKHHRTRYYRANDESRRDIH